MTSKFKGQTEDTPPLSSEEGTGAKGRRSKRLANSAGMRTYMQTTPKPSKPMLSGVTTEDKTRQHATIAKVALRQLEKAGLIKRFKVLSSDGTTVLKIRIEFDNTLWTEDLELK